MYVYSSLRLPSDQCTMRLCTQLELSKICKSKGLVFAQFSSESDNSSFDRWKTLKKDLKKYSNTIFAKNGISIGKKNCWGCLWKLKFCTQVYHFVLRKTPQNIFSQGRSSLSKWNLKYTNICINIFTVSNILQEKFEEKLKK